MLDKLFRTFIIIVVAALVWLLVQWFLTLMAVGLPSAILTLIGLVIVVAVLYYIAVRIWGITF